MILKEQLILDYKQAMRDKDVTAKAVLSFVIAQIKNKEIDTRKDVEEKDVIKLMQKEIKSIDEAIGFLEKANKQEAIKFENKKKAILKEYLPELLSEEKTKEIVLGLIEEHGISDLKTQRGLLMKELMAKYSGQLDGSVVNGIVNGLVS